VKALRTVYSSLTMVLEEAAEVYCVTVLLSSR
jgi:hypothetical protein